MPPRLIQKHAWITKNTNYDDKNGCKYREYRSYHSQNIWLIAKGTTETEC